MSIMMTMTVAMYAISVPDVFVFENTLCCYDEQNKLVELCFPAAIATFLIKQRNG